MYTVSVWYTKLKEHQGSYHCCLELPNCSAFVLLFYIISLLLQLFFQLFALFENKKSHLGLDFIANYTLIASSIWFHHGGTLLVASGSGVDSIGYHQDYFSHNRAGIGRAVLWVRTTDVWKPSGTHGRTKLIAQVINGLGNQGPLVLPHVVCKYKILTNLQIMRIISIINIMRLIDIIHIICITLSLGDCDVAVKLTAT